jgi:ligand-binding sensor domain-containing protein
MSLILSCQKEIDAIDPSEVEKWTYFNNENGLPSNQINCIAEDGFNNIWIGTNKGLVKYDGQNFTHYSKNTGLPSDSIYSLYWDQSNELLVGTQNGFGKINYIGTYSPILHINNLQCVNFCKDNIFSCIYCATNIGVVSYYSYVLDLDYISIDSTFINGIYQPDPVYDIAVDNNNHTWVAAKKGIYVYTDYNIEFYSNENLSGLGYYYKYNVNELFKDKTGNIWIAPSLDQKLMYYNGSNFVNDSIFFGVNNYKSLAQDHYNNYWISILGYGVLNYGGGMTKVYNTSNSKIRSNNINVIFYDSNNNIWLGSNENGLMYYQNIKPLQFRFDSSNKSKITPNPIN